MNTKAQEGSEGSSKRELNPIPLEEDRDSKVPGPGQPRTGATLRRCPGCSADVRSTTDRCGVCGFEFGRPAGSGASGAPGAVSPKKRGKKDLCASCGYDMSGLQGRRCPECGEFAPVTGRDHDRVRSIQAEHRYMQYWKPLTMFVVGMVGVALVLTLSGEAESIPSYFIGLVMSVPIGLATYWILCVIWIGFDEPLKVIALKLLGIYAVVDLVSVVMDQLPIPVVGWLVPTVTYIGLLASMLDLEYVEAIAVAVATSFARGVVAVLLVTMVLG